jgi:hypothetical protein
MRIPVTAEKVEGNPQGWLLATRLQVLNYELVNNPEPYQALQPANGWGTLQDLTLQCGQVAGWLSGRDLGALELTWCL